MYRILNLLKRLLSAFLLVITVNLNATDLVVLPGESIQGAIDSVYSSGVGIVTLASGEHNIISPVKMRSNVILQGEARLSSALKTTEDIKMIKI